MNKNQVENYIKGKFKEYYLKFCRNIPPPPNMSKRELGFLLFIEKHMIRHKGFTTINDLRAFIKRITPSDIYYSSAYYIRPEERMDRKGWLGADLVFDIDADHLDTPCKPIHDRWICEKCSNVGKWPTPEICPKCKGKSLKEESWICELCLNQAKEETSKLLEMLSDELGFSPHEIYVYFTGHRGYHVHVRNEKIRTLGSEERKEIVDYVAGVGLDLDLMNLAITQSEELSGWRYRIDRELEKLLLYTDEKELLQIGLKGRALKSFLILKEKMKGGGLKDSAYNVIKARFKNILWAAVKECSAQVDTVVTTDIHRLVRLPGTLNRKTGLRVVEVEKMDEFDPLNESVSLQGYGETVYIVEAPKFRLGNSEYGPYRRETKKLPIEAALMLVCKGKANPIGV